MSSIWHPHHCRGSTLPHESRNLQCWHGRTHDYHTLHLSKRKEYELRNTPLSAHLIPASCRLRHTYTALPFAINTLVPAPQGPTRGSIEPAHNRPTTGPTAVFAHPPPCQSSQIAHRSSPIIFLLSPRNTRSPCFILRPWNTLILSHSSSCCSLESHSHTSNRPGSLSVGIPSLDSNQYLERLSKQRQLPLSPTDRHRIILPFHTSPPKRSPDPRVTPPLLQPPYNRSNRVTAPSHVVSPPRQIFTPDAITTLCFILGLSGTLDFRNCSDNIIRL